MEGYKVAMKLSCDPNIYKKKRVYYGNRYEYHWFAFDMMDTVRWSQEALMAAMIESIKSFK